MEHDGWSNYSTWCVNLLLANDEPLYMEMCRMERFSDFAARIKSLVSQVKMYEPHRFENVEMDQVNYDEIAKEWI